MKVAIVGMSDSSRHRIPWNDPEWELWGLGVDSERYRFARVFEMHNWADLIAELGDDLAPYLEKLGCCSRVLMHDTLEAVPGSEVYPFERVAAVCGGWWESSIGYALALAITEGAKEIAVYGVDMKANEEYAYQYPNCAFLLGLARGKGIKVTIPEESPLLKFSGFNGYKGRYGVTA